MGDDQQKRNKGKKRKQPQENDPDPFWAAMDIPILVDDDQGKMGDFAEFDASNYGEILGPITPDSSSSSSKYGVLSSVSSELKSSYPKRHRGSGIIPVSAPKPFDPKQKGVAISPELKHTERRRIERREEEGGCSVPLCAVCWTDQQLIRLSPCGHCVCPHCLGEKIVKEHAEKVRCPNRNCRNEWTPDQFQRWWYVPREVSDRWLDAASEARALANPRYFACPICEAVLTDDERGFLIRACTACWRILCVNCRVPWHMGLLCSEFMAYGYEYHDVAAAELLSSIAF